mmetsp:Transcript_102835/g.187826  ORF Transcript_102835/g.187826 Transcript_102835/m.187826 type:complete len:217 (-) Transcript_102835:478-1128(-)
MIKRHCTLLNSCIVSLLHYFLSLSTSSSSFFNFSSAVKGFSAFSALPSFGIARTLFFIAASSSSTEELFSNARNLSSEEDLAPGDVMARVLETSASASSCSTFSLMRSKAATDEEVPTPASMSLTLVAAFAVRARAMIWSFFAFASAIFASNSCMDSYSCWTEFCCTEACSLRLSAVSNCCARRVNASLARSSSSLAMASCARSYHFAASSSAVAI